MQSNWKWYKTRKGKAGGADVVAIYFPTENSPRQQWRGFAEKLLFSTNYLLQRGRCCNGRYWDMPLGETAPKPSTIADDAAWMVAI